MIEKFYLHKGGELIQVGSCPKDQIDAQRRNGLEIGIGDPPPHIRYPEPPPKTISELRAAEYPPIEDYLDAVVKGDQAAVNAYIEKCLAVKAKYPKQ